ncbi:hypothetical protein OS493_032136, partial [Desmophyllum pertusum]
MALAQILTPGLNPFPCWKKFGRSPQGSYASYQLSVTEDNFKVYCDITSVTRVNPGNHSEQIITYLSRFPLKSSDEQFEMPTEISEAEKSLLDSLQVDADKLNDIERKTRGQSDCPEWKAERKFRFTASNFGQIRDRKRHHENLASKGFESGHVISLDAPYLGASPDGKVIDPGCSEPFGLSE